MESKPSKKIDLRSDTVTQPCPRMRDVMRKAVVGDDVIGDDPTVAELEEKMAFLLGREAGLFVPSGTMANAVAIRSHTQPGDEIITEKKSHIYVYEGGGYAALSGCSVALVDGEYGIMSPRDVGREVRKSEDSRSHYPNTSLIALENTSNRGGGTCYPINTIDEITKIAKSKNCRIHLDGARFFNAVCFTGLSPKRLARGMDSISICLSKGLGSPVGSVLLGSRKFISNAHRWRKMFGGGMRQAGILAAAGIYALENNITRLREDHLNAQSLANGLNEINGLSVDLKRVQTNIVNVLTERPANDWVKKLYNFNVLCFAISENCFRMVTHLNISKTDINKTIEITAKAF